MENEITILGSNGTKGLEGGTSAFYINAQNVIDAGNLLHPLKKDVAKIETIWLTHSHLDHILDIAYILDSHFEKRVETLVVRGLPETLEAVQKHFINDIIWPDFTKIKLTDSNKMAMVCKSIDIGEVYRLDETTSIYAFETDHTVPSCGYVVKKNSSSVLITADTYDLSCVERLVNSDKSISTLVIECSFPSEMEKLAIISKHLTPKLLFSGLKSIEILGLQLKINHIKPLYKKSIIEEIAQKQGVWEVEILEDGKKIHF